MGNLRELDPCFPAVSANTDIDLLIDDVEGIIWDHGHISGYPDTHHIDRDDDLRGLRGRSPMPSVVYKHYFCQHCCR